jgi:hypothetical protein
MLQKGTLSTHNPFHGSFTHEIVFLLRFFVLLKLTPVSTIILYPGSQAGQSQSAVGRCMCRVGAARAGDGFHAQDSISIKPHKLFIWPWY